MLTFPESETDSVSKYLVSRLLCVSIVTTKLSVTQNDTKPVEDVWSRIEFIVSTFWSTSSFPLWKCNGSNMKVFKVYLFWAEPKATHKGTWSSTTQAMDEEAYKKAFHFSQSNTRQSPRLASEDGRWRKAATSRKLQRYHQQAFEEGIRRSSKLLLRAFSTAHFEGFLYRWRLPCERFSGKFLLATHPRLIIIEELGSKVNWTTYYWETFAWLIRKNFRRQLESSGSKISPNNRKQ